MLIKFKVSNFFLLIVSPVAWQAIAIASCLALANTTKFPDADHCGGCVAGRRLTTSTGTFTPSHNGCSGSDAFVCRNRGNFSPDAPPVQHHMRDGPIAIACDFIRRISLSSGGRVTSSAINRCIPVSYRRGDAGAYHCCSSSPKMTDPQQRQACFQLLTKTSTASVRGVWR